LFLPSYLEKRVGEMEEQRQVELKTLKEEKEQLSTLVLRQTAVIEELEQQLLRATTNNSALQRQQQELLETVNNLINTISIPTGGGG
jgi:small-conductance mechanosensitive channel